MKKLFPLFALFILACSNNNSEQIVNMYSQRHYDVDQLQYDNFETPDLKKSIEEVTGKNMDWFFKQWVYEPGFPEYEVKWNFNQRNNSVKIKVSQIQDLSLNNLFKMPVRIKIDKNFHTIWVEEKKLEYEIPVLKRPKMIY